MIEVQQIFHYFKVDRIFFAFLAKVGGLYRSLEACSGIFVNFVSACGVIWLYPVLSWTGHSHWVKAIFSVKVKWSW